MYGDKYIKKAYKAILEHDFEKAIEWFEKAISIDPSNGKYHYKLSFTYFRSNKWIKAFEHAHIACKLEPNNEQFRSHLQQLQARKLLMEAQSFFNQSEKHLYMAVTLLHQATELDPLLEEGYLMLGEAYAALQEYAKAIQAIKEVLRLDPGHEIASRLLKEYENLFKQFMTKN